MQAWATWVCNTFSLDEHRCAFKVSTRPGCRPQTNWLFLGRSASSFTFIAWLGRDKEIILFYFFVSLPHCRLFSRMVLLEVRGEIGPTTQHPHFELLRTSWVCRRCGWGLGAYGVQLAGPIARKCRKATGTLNSLENQIDIVFSLFWDAAFWRCGPVICTMDWWLGLSWGIESIEFIYEFIAYPHRCNISHWREPGSEDCEYIEYTYITYIYVYIHWSSTGPGSAGGEVPKDTSDIKWLQTEDEAHTESWFSDSRLSLVTALGGGMTKWKEERNEWVGGWMDGWMDRWLNGWTHEMVEWMNDMTGNNSVNEQWVNKWEREREWSMNEWSEVNRTDQCWAEFQKIDYEWMSLMDWTGMEWMHGRNEQMNEWSAWKKRRINQWLNGWLSIWMRACMNE